MFSSLDHLASISNNPKIKSNFKWSIVTVFENHPKCRIRIFQFWYFSPIFCLFKSDLSGNTVWLQASGFQKLAKVTILGTFNELLFTQNVNVARSARNVECDFFCDFQALWRAPRHLILSPNWLLNFSEFDLLNCKNGFLTANGGGFVPSSSYFDGLKKHTFDTHYSTSCRFLEVH